MQYVSLADADREALMALWNKELGQWFPMREGLLRQSWFEDRNLLGAGCLAALDETDGRLAGFVVSKKWTDSLPGIDFPEYEGWIGALLVDAEYRRRGIGGELLKRAEAALQDAGVTKIVLGNDLHRRLFPGIPEESSAASAGWFERRGYQPGGKLQDLLRIYDPGEPEDMPEPEGITVRTLRADDRERFQSFMHEHFPGRWEYGGSRYWTEGGSGREYVVMERGERIIGFCRINDSESPMLAQNIYWAPLFQGELGGVGPLGIDPAFRGKGYGAAIVEAGIATLRQRGIGHIVIDATHIAAFYEKLGYSIWRTYLLYSKKMSGKLAP